MARRRMIDPNFWMSEDVGKLTIFERLLLIGMFSNADDEGKGRANLPMLRSMVFPYDDIKLSDMEKGIEHIKKRVELIIYDVEDSKYYKFIGWLKWQRVDKPQNSLIPEPSENRSENDSKNDSENDSRLKEEKRKEVNIKEVNIKEVSQPFKINYADHVKMTEEEYDKLIEKYGEIFTKEKITDLDLWKGSTGKTKASDYLTILSWIHKDEKENKKKIDINGHSKNMNKGKELYDYYKNEEEREAENNAK